MKCSAENADDACMQARHCAMQLTSSEGRSPASWRLRVSKACSQVPHIRECCTDILCAGHTALWSRDLFYYGALCLWSYRRINLCRTCSSSRQNLQGLISGFISGFQYLLSPLSASPEGVQAVVMEFQILRLDCSRKTATVE